MGDKQYSEHFKNIWFSGINWLASILKESHPYQIPKQFSVVKIMMERQRLLEAGKTLYQIDREMPEFLFQALILKTGHIPLTLANYVKGIVLSSTFKSIHLEYLKNAKLESIADVHQLFNTLWSE